MEEHMLEMHVLSLGSQRRHFQENVLQDEHFNLMMISAKVVVRKGGK